MLTQKHKGITKSRLANFAATGGLFRETGLQAALYSKRASFDEAKMSLHVYSVPQLARIPFASAVVTSTAAAPAYRDAKPGDHFGPSWSTHWFHLEFKLPDGWHRDEEEIWLEFDPSCEALIYSKDGHALQGITGGNVAERRVHFPLSAVTPIDDHGSYELYIEVGCNGLFGNSTDGPDIAPPNPDRTFRLASVELLAPYKPAWDLKYDFEILRMMINELEGSNPVRANQALMVANQVCNTFDRTTPETMRASIFKCLDVTRAFFSTSRTTSQVQHRVTAIGNCHIDTAWLWPYDETKRKIARSWATQAQLMDTYPFYKFAASQAQQFDWLLTGYPDVFKRLQDLHKRDQFVPIGGTWVEMDANIPSGEAFVRQFVYGQRFFEEHFGERCKVFWLPDTFGYSAQLPQIVRLADMKYFFTQKLSWNNINKFPHTTFYWAGLDGSKVITHMAPSETYVARVTVEELVKSARNHADSALTNESLMLFGHGDGGGGPGVDQLERLKRFYNADSSSIDGIPRVAPGHPNDFYERVERDSGDKLVTWKGELYFELHRGTYTSQAFVKKANRECELQLRELEFLATAASVLAAKSDGKMNYTYPKKQFEEMWKKVLLNQFHDVLPGSSIEMVFDDARAIYNDVYKQLAELRVAADEALAGAVPAATGAHEYSVVNTLTWPVSGVFKLPPSAIIAGPHVQPAVKLPSLASTGSDALNSLISKTLSTNTGFVQFDSVPGMSVSSAASLPIDSVSDESVSIKQNASGSFVLRNKFVTAEFNKGGRLVSFVDNELSRELVARNADGKPQAGGANRFVMFDDVPIYWDAWDVEIYHLETAKDCPPASRISIYEKGPLVASLLVEYQLSPKSKLVQTISLTASSSRLDFHTLVDWNESRRMLKVEFPFDLHSDIATYESAYGWVQRPTHFNTSWDYARFEVCCHRFADLSEFGYGVSILNDSKYGFATHGNVMRLSLLRSPKAPDANCDMGTHEFRYAIYPHKGTFFESNVVEVAHEFNSPPRILPSTAASSASSSTTTDSSLDAGLSMFAVKGARNVVLDAVKLAEDSNDIVLRFYEAYGGKAFARIESQFKIAKATKCNLLEEDLQDVELSKDGLSFALTLKAFEIVTIKLTLH